ncbi:MAG: acetyltransferase, partial [Bacteroidales bacterium]|nr:acetyltransferase [Bacteroidales bacterium]
MAINTYKIVDTLWGWISKMSFRKMYYLSDFIFFLLYHVFRYRRKLVRKNLQDSFPEREEKEIKDIERKFYHHFCDYIVET